MSTGIAQASQWPQLADREWLATELATKTGAQVARELGASKTTVSRATRAHGLTPSGRNPRAVEVQDMIGQRFGHLTVVRAGGSTRYGRIVWCQCDCGREIDRIAARLAAGTLAAHCGCQNAIRAAERHRLRGRKAVDGYTDNSYRSMLDRCYRPTTNGYENYGGRGITVCDAWRQSIDAFIADMGQRPIGMSLDRVDPDGNYEPSNCRWATPAEQGANRRARGLRERALRARVEALEEQLRELGVEPVVQSVGP